MAGWSRAGVFASACARAGDIGAAQAADAIARALKVLGVRRRVSVITPYYPLADPRIREYIDAIGYETVRTSHLCCGGPVPIAHSTPRQLRDSLLEVDGDDVEAIIQFGANLAFARQAADPVRGFGALLERH